MGQIKLSKKDKFCSKVTNNKIWIQEENNRYVSFSMLVLFPLFMYKDNVPCFSLSYDSIKQGRLSKNFIYLLIQWFVVQRTLKFGLLPFLKLQLFQLHVFRVECLYG